ncbi:outer membrane beta-barrel protein [Rhodopseudomonas sp. P2A-2r]|uniref:outer membrane protein n=1 Tax=Rhodopseudomonas sp. P2A-2r TaxID=2991972 RepID=UPI002234266E|nr:outer membrane beta-barrel protein [Rhodopseudomonas sp. P2A-2r]UZE47098.1 outer membrane beta-barrel protein [Rhodopseudomonas sp. P2A-2r]
MKKFLLASAALATLGMATSASAADLAARRYTKAPPMMVAMYDWSGFYIGANAGYGTSRKCWDSLGSLAAPTLAVSEGCHDASGAVAGGQIGYRWQSSAWVFGLEAQGDWADLSGSNVSTAFPAFTNRSKIQALGLFTGQVGYAWNNALLYVKGGAGVASDKYNYFLNGATVNTGTASETRWGGTVGVGLEYGFTPNWSVGVEYDHIFLGSRNVTFTSPATTSDRIGQDVDMVTARINYRWGGPVVAKY